MLHVHKTQRRQTWKGTQTQNYVDKPEAIKEWKTDGYLLWLSLQRKTTAHLNSMCVQGSVQQKQGAERETHFNLNSFLIIPSQLLPVLLTTPPQANTDFWFSIAWIQIGLGRCASFITQNTAPAPFQVNLPWEINLGSLSQFKEVILTFEDLTWINLKPGLKISMWQQPIGTFTFVTAQKKKHRSQ